MSCFRSVFSVSLIVASAAAAHGQCPDGTPPPCRGAVTLPIARRINPALNPRTWIVVPFGNVTKAPDLDWLRDASVNLLTLEVGRWADVQVVNDKRVGDLLREVPAARSAQILTLSDGLAIARRAGAGNLVMGDFIRLGKSTRLVANVFDVRNGTRLRTANFQATADDSLLVAFGALAREVLALPPPPDAKLGALGTSRIDAYQEYLAGLRAFNRFDLVEAMKRLGQAIALDSTFALAHYKRSILWDFKGRADSASRADAMAAAARSATLPPRERALIDARVAASGGEHTKACEFVRPLVTRDSMDVEAWYQLGTCASDDKSIEPIAGDSIRGRFRGSWNVALAAFQRVLRLDPAYHPAFAYVLKMLSAERRMACVPPATATGRCTLWIGYVLRDGDSLITTPARWSNGDEERSRQLIQRERDRSRYLNLTEARRVAQDWVAAAPTEDRAHLALGEVLLSLGEVNAADAQLKGIRTMVDSATRQDALESRFELAVKLGRAAEALALADTSRREEPDARWVRATEDVLLGRLGLWRAWIDYAFPRNQWPKGAEAYYHTAAPLAVLGVVDTSVTNPERAHLDVWATRDTSCSNSRCVRYISPTMEFAPRAPRAWWPPLTGETTNPLRRPSWAIARGDTAELRRSALALDSMSHARIAGGNPEDGASAIAAEAYLAMHDTLSALRMARFAVDSVMPVTPIFVPLDLTSSMPSRSALWPRMMLVRADLAAALGQKDEARTWYTRVMELWATADPEVQPTMARIRAARAALGAKSP